MIHATSLSNVSPLCPVFGECGGCSYQHLTYKDELTLKQKQIHDGLVGLSLNLEEVLEPIVASPQEYYYRHRLDLKFLKTRQNDYFLGFTSSLHGKNVPIDQCYIADKKISDYLPQLKTEAAEKWTAKYRQANLTVKIGQERKVFWGGMGKKSLRMKPEEYFWIEIEGRKVFYSLDTFFQANLSILPLVFERIKKFDFWQNDVEFYDLYGGVGLFTIGLIDKIKKAHIIEDNKHSVLLAEHNKNFHQFANVEIHQGRVEDRFPEIFQSNTTYVKVAMIDPPRAGLSPEARDLLTRFKQLHSLLYLSCNPESLVNDLKAFMANGWCVAKIMPFDFFPKTKHLETLVLLTKE